MASRPNVALNQAQVAAELAVLREILTRLESKVDSIDAKTDSHATQIDRWKTVGKVMTPVLLGLGVLANKIFDQLVVWLGTKVHP